MATERKSESAATNGVQVSQRIIGLASERKPGDNYLPGVNDMSHYGRSVKPGSEEERQRSRNRGGVNLNEFISKLLK